MTKSCGRGGTICLTCLDDMTKSCIERDVDDIEYKSQEERCVNNMCHKTLSTSPVWRGAQMISSMSPNRNHLNI